MDQDAKVKLTCSYLQKYVKDNPAPEYTSRLVWADAVNRLSKSCGSFFMPVAKLTKSVFTFVTWQYWFRTNFHEEVAPVLMLNKNSQSRICFLFLLSVQFNLFSPKSDTDCTLRPGHFTRQWGSIWEWMVKGFFGQLSVHQGNPTSIFGKYLFGRRFEI